MTEIDYPANISTFFLRLRQFPFNDCIKIFPDGCVIWLSFFQHEFETYIGKVISEKLAFVRHIISQEIMRVLKR